MKNKNKKMKHTITKSEAPVSFIGEYIRQETPQLTYKAIDGVKANEELEEKVKIWNLLLNLSPKEVEEHYKDNIGAAYVFNHIISLYLEDQKQYSCDFSRHLYLNTAQRLEELKIYSGSLYRGSYICFSFKQLIKDILKENPELKNLKGYEVDNIILHGLNELRDDKVILDFSMEPTHPKAFNHWSIFLT